MADTQDVVAVGPLIDSIPYTVDAKMPSVSPAGGDPAVARSNVSDTGNVGGSTPSRPSRGLSTDDKIKCEQIVASKLMSPAQARAKHSQGSVVIGSEPAPATSATTSRGYRQRGSTKEENLQFEARIDAARTAITSSKHRPAPHVVVDTSRGEKLDSTDPSPRTRRVKGMSPKEVEEALAKQPVVSPADILSKHKTGHWSGPTKLHADVATLQPSETHLAMSASHECGLALSTAIGSRVMPSTKKTLRSEGEMPEFKVALNQALPGTTAEAIRRRVMGTSLAIATTDHAASFPASAKSPSLISRFDESLSARAVKSATDHKSRAAAMMTSSLQLDSGPVPAAHFEAKPRVVVPPPLPAHPFGPPESDAPRSARVRMQRALQSSWIPLPTTESAGSNVRQRVKLDFIPTPASEMTARQRFQQQQRGSIQFG